MDNTSSLRLVKDQGWRMGFSNLFNVANGSFWRTKKWLIQSGLCFLILNGMFLVIWSIPTKTISEALASLPQMTSLEDMLTHPFSNIFMTYFLVCTIGLPVAAIIIGQDAIIGERISGTGAWVLSKPVSRPAFILSKLASSTISILVTGVLVQSVGVYSQLSIKTGSAWPAAEFAGAMGLVFLNLMFYLTLTFMLGALFSNRAVVLGISLAAALAGPFILYAVPVIKEITPWGFFYGSLKDMPPGISLALGYTPESVIPILGTAVMCIIFLAVALFRFQREEF